MKFVNEIKALAPAFENAAQTAEANRKPDDQIIQALCEMGLFKHFVPQKFGGDEGNIHDFIAATQAISALDASHGWVASFYMEHNWMISLFPLEAQEEVFAKRGYALAPACVAPTGTAEKVEGGYRVSGQWAFGTGICHADWVLVACPDPDLIMGFFLLPFEDVEMLDTWHMAGMAATGSNDIKISNAFVPAHRAISLIEMGEGRAPGTKIYDSTMYRIPMAPFLACVVGAVATGAARGALAFYQNRLEERLIFLSGEKQADRPLARARLARATADLRGADLLLHDAIGILERLANENDAANMLERARIRMQVLRSVEIARGIVNEIAGASGAGAQQTNSLLQRTQRDLTVLSAHAIVEPDTVSDLQGRIMLGMPPNIPLV